RPPAPGRPAGPAPGDLVGEQSERPRGAGMNFLGLLRIAIKGFSRHRLRALLTTLGIMIGVGAFIAMVALGRGATARVAAKIAAMGSNVLIVRGGGGSFGGVRGGGGMTLNDSDVEAIRREADAVRYAAPEVSTMAQVVWGGVNWSTQILG